MIRRSELRVRQPQLYQERLAVGRALLEVQSSNLPFVVPYYTDDIEYHDPIVDIYGIEAMTGFLYRLFGSSPDLVTTVKDETLVKGVYSATWTMVGQFAGVPYDAKGITIIKFRDKTSQVYYQRDYYSEGDIMANFPGLDEAIVGFRTFYRCAVDPTYECPLEGPPTIAGGDKADTPSTATFERRQNALNPFNPATKISFGVPEGGADVSLRICDVSGRLLRTLVDGFEPSGTRTVTWHGTSDQGRTVAGGISFYRLTGPGYSEMKKMMLLK